MKATILAWLIAALPLVGQTVTMINGSRTITGSWDAAGAPATRPVRTGTTAQRPTSCAVGEMYFATDGQAGRKLSTCESTNTWRWTGYAQGTSNPSTCQAGEIFFRTDAAAGQNLMLCTQTNVWTQLSGGGGGGVTSVGLSMPSEFSVTGSPVTASGVLTGSWVTQTANRVFASPNGFTGNPGFRALVAADIPSLDASKVSTGTLDAARMPATAVLSSGSYSNPSWISSIDWSKLTSVPATFTPSAHNHSANEISSGTLDAARLPATVVLTSGSYANPAWINSIDWGKLTGVPATFTPAAHAHSAAEITSGTLALARGGTNQATWTAGRCVQVSADGTKLESHSGACGGAGGGYDPEDASTVTILEDFLSGTTTTGQVGKYGFRLSGGTYSYLAMGAINDRIGVLSQSSTTTSGNAAILWFSPSTNSTFASDNTFHQRDFVARWYGRISDTASADYRVGISESTATSGGSPSASSTTWIFRYSTGFGDNTKNGGLGSWVVQLCGYGGGNCGSDTSGATHVMNIAPDLNWHMFEISRTGGTLSFRIDNNTPVTVCASGCNLTLPGTPAGEPMTPWSTVQTNAAAAKAWHWDRFYFSMTGLSTF